MLPQQGKRHDLSCESQAHREEILILTPGRYLTCRCVGQQRLEHTTAVHKTDNLGTSITFDTRQAPCFPYVLRSLSAGDILVAHDQNPHRLRRVRTNERLGVLVQDREATRLTLRGASNTSSSSGSSLFGRCCRSRSWCLGWGRCCCRRSCSSARPSRLLLLLV